MARKHASRRGYVIIAVLFGVITLIGMESLHWSFLRTEEISIAGVLICLGLTGFRKYW